MKPSALIILDGWGVAPPGDFNAVALADTPCLDQIRKDYPFTVLECSGKSVGLPDGVMGNSEVGHLNIGAGRIVYQDLLRIDMAIENGSFFKNPSLLKTFEKVKANKGALHLMGLLSDGGVHSHIRHLMAILKAAHDHQAGDIFIHAILDGRDTPPDSGAGFVRILSEELKRYPSARIASLCGRYFAMDRDTRWDRIEKAYRLYTGGQGVKETDPVEAVEKAYARGQTDEFLEPTIIIDSDGIPSGLVRENDAIFFFNFRADRAREITRAFTEEGFNHFPVKKRPNLCTYLCMTSYDETFRLPVAFEPEHLDMVLGEVISRRGIQQVRIAETEKYAHVTYFFNGGEEEPFEGEDRILVPSPREIATYDMKPEMSAHEVARAATEMIQSGRYAFLVVNFANMDMVGHTGILNAAVAACKTVDRCVERILNAAIPCGWTAFVTADHGNAEQMIDSRGQAHTAHTTNPVPFIMVDNDRTGTALKKGILADIAPTILEAMEIEKPGQMTGNSLI